MQAYPQLSHWLTMSGNSVKKGSEMKWVCIARDSNFVLIGNKAVDHSTKFVHVGSYYKRICQCWTTLRWLISSWIINKIAVKRIGQADINLYTNIVYLGRSIFLTTYRIYRVFWWLIYWILFTHILSIVYIDAIYSYFKHTKSNVGIVGLPWIAC